MSKKDEKFKKIGKEILQDVGGTSNISSVTHCMTRLRFNLKDESIPNDNNIQNIDGVIGVNRSGGQYQVIIGQSVSNVYDALTDVGGLTKNAPIDENLDKNLTTKETFSWKKLGNNILNKLAGSLTPLIPILIGASMFKMFAAVLGPTMLNVFSTGTNTYKLLTFVGDAGFYFFPIFLGYTSAKQFKTSPMIAMFLGAILLDPNLTSIVKAGKAFTVYGIPMKLVDYSSTVVPILLSVWVMSYIERFIKRHVPETISTIVVPTLTIIIMLPITLTILGPAGSYLGQYVSDGLLAFGKFGGIWSILGIAIIGALWELLVMTGMHLIMITTMMVIFTTVGQENFISIGGLVASFSVAGMCLGAAMALKNKKEKALSYGYFIASFIGGVTEPGLYGVAVRYKRPFLGMMIGGFLGGLYAGATHVTAYVLVPVANFLGLTALVGGSTANMINGIISAAISLIGAAVATYLINIKQTSKKEDTVSNTDFELVEA
ncbi:PTS fructose transporter subunit IIB [Companilactobacillus farciminis]|nr:PTS fructose transporter subunit IIB [Companilactobacillus farciminis]